MIAILYLFRALWGGVFGGLYGMVTAVLAIVIPISYHFGHGFTASSFYNDVSTFSCSLIATIGNCDHRYCVLSYILLHSIQTVFTIFNYYSYPASIIVFVSKGPPSKVSYILYRTYSVNVSLVCMQTCMVKMYVWFMKCPHVLHKYM